MTSVRNFFADLFPAWRAEEWLPAMPQRQRLGRLQPLRALKDGGYTEVPRTIQAPSMDISNEPASDEPT
jgi:hypothetical protein